MEKTALGFIIILLALSITACKQNDETETTDMKDSINVNYSLETYTTPIWHGNTITNETVTFTDWDDTTFLDEMTTPSTEVLFKDPVRIKALLYPADEIYAVYSCDMKTEYVKGEDWDIADGKLVRYPNSRIPIITEETYYPENPQEGNYFESTVDGHKYIMFGESDTMVKWQINVTYKHNGVWEGPIPTAQTEKIDSFIKKLEKGEEVTVLFYGDSITTGANSTGPIGMEPYNPSFAHMIVDFIAEKYGYTVSKEADPMNFGLSAEPFGGEKVIHYINTAVGGTTSAWGIANLEERVIAHNPDLMILGFGMNEGGSSMESFTASISKLVGQVQAACPETDTVLVATMLPHYRVKGFYLKQYKHEDALKELVATSTELNTAKIAVAGVTSVHEYVLKFKEYYDMTGNNVNHPNDFLARIYAAVILQTMFGNYCE